MKDKKLLYECINITQDFIHCYYQYKIKLFIPIIDDNFTFIGPYNFQHAHSKDEFIKMINQRKKQRELKKDINVVYNHYHLIHRHANLWIIEGQYYTSACMPDGRFLLAKTRSTFVWKRKKDAWSLLHLHTSHARDIPLIYDSPIQENTIEKYSKWFDFINNLDKLEYEKKRIAYDDIDGTIHYLLPTEIIYVQVNDKLCTIHTFGEPITIRCSLTEILNNNPY